MNARQFGLRSLTCLFAALSLLPICSAEDEEDPYYEGFFSGYYLYLRQADLSVGILSDAAIKGVYEKETAIAVCNIHGTSAATVQKDLLKLAKGDDTDEEDAAVLKSMAKSAGLVKAQADTLAALLEGDKEQAAKFSEAREATSKSLAALEKEIKELLGE